jgi:hypothetical protein
LIKKLLLTTVIAMTLAAAPAFAQDAAGNGTPPPSHHCMPHGDMGAGDHQWHHGPHGPMRMFDKMDTNHDGKISYAEFMAAQKKHFEKLDLNHDGYITKDEMRQAFRMRMEHWKEHGGWHHDGHGFGDHGPGGPGFEHGPAFNHGEPNRMNFQSGVGYKAPQQVPDYSHANDDDSQ